MNRGGLKQLVRFFPLPPFYFLGTFRPGKDSMLPLPRTTATRGPRTTRRGTTRATAPTTSTEAEEALHLAEDARGFGHRGGGRGLRQRSRGSQIRTALRASCGAFRGCHGRRRVVAKRLGTLIRQ
jgi:hypothetical protein